MQHTTSHTMAVHSHENLSTYVAFVQVKMQLIVVAMVTMVYSATAAEGERLSFITSHTPVDL